MPDCKMSICLMSVCLMSICLMSVCLMSICLISVCLTSICLLSVCLMFIFQMSVGRLLVGQMSVSVMIFDHKTWNPLEGIIQSPQQFLFGLQMIFCFGGSIVLAICSSPIIPLFLLTPALSYLGFCNIARSTVAFSIFFYQHYFWMDSAIN